MAFTKLVGGVDFGEGPRWHDGRLWYSDFYQASIYAVSTDGEREKMLEHDDRPSGLGWLPGGDLIFVSMTRQALMRWDGETVQPYADLSGIATGLCNDMVVRSDGTAYVGNFGFDLENQADFAPAALAMVSPAGEVSVAAEGLAFPNGAVLTPDESTLIVGQTFASDYRAFDVAADGSLSNSRQWAEIPGTAPDGCALDADGAIWFSDATGQKVVRVAEGGEVLASVETPQSTYACMLGGDDGTTLFVLCAAGAHPDEVAGKGEGGIWTMAVEAGHAGRP